MEPDPPLTAEELANKRNQLSMLHSSNVRRAYREAWNECRMDGDKLPSAAAIQTLVTIWKYLRKSP